MRKLAVLLILKYFQKQDFRFNNPANMQIQTGAEKFDSVVEGTGKVTGAVAGGTTGAIVGGAIGNLSRFFFIGAASHDNTSRTALVLISS